MSLDAIVIIWILYGFVIGAYAPATLFFIFIIRFVFYIIFVKI